MPVTIDWFDAEKTAIVQTFVGDWTWEEHFEVIEEFREMMETVDHVVDYVANFEKVQGVPKGTLTNFRNALKNSHPRTGMIVVISTNRFVNALLKTLTTLYNSVSNQGIYQVNTVEEAINLLEKRKQHIQRK